MKLYNKLIIASLCLGFLTVACDDYLDVPVNGTLTQENFYQSDKDVNSAILSAYDILTWNNNLWGWAAPVLIKTLPSDEGTSGGASATDQPDYDSLDDYDYDSANAKVEGLWNLAYWGIYRCNLVIDNVVGDTPFKEQAVGEAYALRAYNYLELVTNFGGVPILTTQIAPSEYNQARASVADVYAQIEKDLEIAIAQLPSKDEYSAGDKFRMSSGTAQALLGKAELYQGNNAEALTAFQAVINSDVYSLEPDFAKVFTSEGEFGSGSLLEAVFTNEIGHNWGTNPWDLGISERNWEANMHIQLMGPRETEFGGASPDLGLVEGWGFNYPSAKIYDAYVAAGDEVRRAATVITEEEWNAGGGEATGNAYDYTGYLRVKYGTNPLESGEPSIVQNYGTNWRLLRYADVLLLAAEAAARDGQESVAHGYLNMVRERAGLDDITPAGNDLITAIANERFLELAFEGFRLYDLIRWGIAADNIDGFVEGKHNLFPIPANEITRAPALEQNPGW